MKKSILMLAAGVLLLATPSCKKGENDPALSLASRKSRFSGEWDVTAKSATSSTISGNTTWSTTTTLSGNTETTVNSSTTSGTTTSTTSTRKITRDTWTIDKDGTFTRNYDYTYTDEVEDWGGFTTTTSDYTITTTVSGTWSFVGKAKGEYGNKERVVFNILNSSENESRVWVTKLNSDNSTIDDGTDSEADTDVWSHGEAVMAIDIDQLKGKEMIWKMDGAGSSTSSETVGSTTTTSSSTSTGLETWTLTAK